MLEEVRNPRCINGGRLAFISINSELGIKDAPMKVHEQFNHNRGFKNISYSLIRTSLESLLWLCSYFLVLRNLSIFRFGFIDSFTNVWREPVNSVRQHHTIVETLDLPRNAIPGKLLESIDNNRIDFRRILALLIWETCSNIKCLNRRAWNMRNAF